MLILPAHIIERLIQVEAGVHYGEPPPPRRRPFIVIERASPVLLSAPHGCRTWRNNGKQNWHEEDEYTAGMALLLAEVCRASVITTIWRTDESDPNYTLLEEGSDYKKKVQQLAEARKFRYLIDLHGAGEDSDKLAPTQWVDLGLGKENRALAEQHRLELVRLLESYLGPQAAERAGRDGFPASVAGRTITAFAWEQLGVQAVQVEMKPGVRIARRRSDATLYGRGGAGGGPYAAPAHRVLAMMQALADFISHLGEH